MDACAGLWVKDEIIVKISTPAHVSGHWTVIEEAVDGKKEGNNANTHPALCNLHISSMPPSSRTSINLMPAVLILVLQAQS